MNTREQTAETRSDIANLTEKRQALETELEGLADDDGIVTDERVFDRLNARIGTLDEILTLKEKQLDVMEAMNRPGTMLEGIEGPTRINNGHSYVPMVPGVDNLDPWRPGTFDATAEGLNARAMAAVEQWNVSDTEKESATRGIESLDPKHGGKDAALHLIRTSDPAYMSAFQKWVRDPQGFQADLDTDERTAWRNVRENSDQIRALSTSGAVLPSPLDPAIILTNAGTNNPMRALARVETTGSDSKRFITSAGVTASYDAEAAEVSDDTPTLTEVTVNVESARAFVAGSIEAVADQPDFANEVSKMFADAKDRLEAAKFITGTGTNEPKGIEVALTGGASEVDAAGETVVADDVYGLVSALPARWRNQGASFQAELSLIQKLYRDWNPSGSEPPMVEDGRLAMLPYHLNSELDPYSGIDAAATATHRPLIVGDWRQFLILDRWGGIVEYIPHLFATANNLPSGQRGFFYHWRSGSDVATINAFRMLKVTTTA